MVMGSDPCNDEGKKKNKRLTDALKNGMVFVVSNFTMGSDFNWLWGDKCKSFNCAKSNMSIDNIKIKTGGKPADRKRRRK